MGTCTIAKRMSKLHDKKIHTKDADPLNKERVARDVPSLYFPGLRAFTLY